MMVVVMGWRGDGTVEEEEGAEGSEGSHLSAHKSFVRRVFRL